MRNRVPPTTRRPAPKQIPHTAYSPPPPPPRRPRDVALRDNRLAHKGKPRDIGRKADTVLDMAAIELIEAARHCQDEISTLYRGFTTERRRLIAKAYGIARGLQKNPQAWCTFIEDEFWQQRKKKPSIEDRKAPLLPVFVFVFKAVDRIRYQRISKYAAALQQYLTHDVPAQEVAAKIKKAGGIEKLYRHSAGSKPNNKTKSQQSLLTLVPGSEAVRRRLEALQVGEKARSIIKRVSSKRGVTLMILSVDRSKA